MYKHRSGDHMSLSFMSISLMVYCEMCVYGLVHALGTKLVNKFISAKYVVWYFACTVYFLIIVGNKIVSNVCEDFSDITVQNLSRPPQNI